MDELSSRGWVIPFHHVAAAQHAVNFPSHDTIEPSIGTNPPNGIPTLPHAHGKSPIRSLDGIHGTRYAKVKVVKPIG